MNRKTYWKDVRKSFSSSKGRVVSIASLMALGSFAISLNTKLLTSQLLVAMDLTSRIKTS